MFAQSCVDCTPQWRLRWRRRAVPRRCGLLSGPQLQHSHFTTNNSLITHASIQELDQRARAGSRQMSFEHDKVRSMTEIWSLTTLQKTIRRASQLAPRHCSAPTRRSRGDDSNATQLSSQWPARCRAAAMDAALAAARRHRTRHCTRHRRRSLTRLRSTPFCAARYHLPQLPRQPEDSGPGAAHPERAWCGEGGGLVDRLV